MRHFSILQVGTPSDVLPEMTPGNHRVLIRFSRKRQRWDARLLIGSKRRSRSPRVCNFKSYTNLTILTPPPFVTNFQAKAWPKPCVGFKVLTWHSSLLQILTIRVSGNKDKWTRNDSRMTSRKILQLNLEIGTPWSPRNRANYRKLPCWIPW